jgi:N-acetylglutamate synthase-like GNAT family acetyltransferase
MSASSISPRNQQSSATDETYAYLTTRGRVTGRMHRIEIWFVRIGVTVYILNGGGRSHWVKNARTTPQVTIEIGTKKFKAHARAPRDVTEDGVARRMLCDKYASTEKGLADFTEASSTVVIAFDLVLPPDHYELVRAQTAEDWEQYHRIRREELFEVRGLTGVYNANHPDEHMSSNIPLLLKFNGRAIGTTRLDVRQYGTAIIRLVAVIKLEQRRGHGRELARLVENFARHAGVKKLLVNAVPDAIGYYAKIGYVREVWDGNDRSSLAAGAIQMSKMLA